MTNSILLPEVLWAQTDKVVYLTINVFDVLEHDLKLLPNKVTFNGSTEEKKYAFDLELFNEYDNEHSRTLVNAHNIFIVLVKKADNQEYWPRLQKEAKKPAYVKVDFSRWRDEDDEEEEVAEEQQPNYMDFAQGMPNMDDYDNSEEEYEDANDEISEEKDDADDAEIEKKAE